MQIPIKRVEDESGIVPYRRGVSLREVAKGTLALFLPASLVIPLGLIRLFGIGDGSARVAAFSLGGLVIVHAAGFGLGLLGLRRWLYSDANVGGLRSMVAGLVSPVVVLFVMVMGEWRWTLAEVQFIVALVGVFMAVAMFFAWLIPTPKELRND